MVRKYTRRNTKQPTPKKDQTLANIDDSRGEETGPERANPANRTGLFANGQKFAFLPATTSPQNILNDISKSLLVTGSTSTVPNTSKSSSTSSRRSSHAGSISIDPSSSGSGSDQSQNTTDVQETTTNNNSRRKGSAPKKADPKQAPTTRRRSMAAAADDGPSAISGVKALQDIARLQSSTELLIPKLPFARLIREVLLEHSYKDLRITPESLQCLQEAAEIYAVQLMEDANRCTLHRDRVTMMPKDLRLALMLRKDSVML